MKMFQVYLGNGKVSGEHGGYYNYEFIVANPKKYKTDYIMSLLPSSRDLEHFDENRPNYSIRKDELTHIIKSIND
jgi:hypothetical protein